MVTQQWSAILARIVPHDADDLDELLVGAGLGAAEPPRGHDIFPQPEAVLMPTTAMKRADAVAVGFRAAAADATTADRAMRLAAFAIERDVEVIVLCETDRSGLERFGFRTERIAGATAQARDACEDELRRFWNLDLVL